MNLYKFHSNPKQLKYYRQATERVPQVAWEKYKDQPKSLMRLFTQSSDNKALRKREAVWAQDAETAYWYARDVLKNPWPDTDIGKKAEATIAGDVKLAYRYALEVLEKPFPLGEATIAGDANWAYYYARDVLKNPWPDTKLGKKAEAAIAGDAHYSYWYALDVLKNPWPDTDIGKKAEAVIAASRAYLHDTYDYERIPYLYAQKFNLKLVDGEFVPK